MNILAINCLAESYSHCGPGGIRNKGWQWDHIQITNPHFYCTRNHYQFNADTVRHTAVKWPPSVVQLWVQWELDNHNWRTTSNMSDYKGY